jgi:outer membrane protein assembly factor BamB
LSEAPNVLVPKEEGLLVGAVSLCRERLLELPPEGREVFEQLYGGEAKALYRDAVRSMNLEKLEELLRRFPASSVYADALESLVLLCLEQGRPTRALFHLKELEALSPSHRAWESWRVRAQESLQDSSQNLTEEQCRAWVGSEAPLQLVWERELGPGQSDVLERIVAVFRKGRLFLSSEDAVEAVDLGTGGLLWKRESVERVYRDLGGGRDVHGSGRQALASTDEVESFLRPVLGKGMVFAKVLKEPGTILRYGMYRDLPREDLVGFDEERGDRLWSALASLDFLGRDFLDHLSLNGIPVVAEDGLYVTGSAWLGALDVFLFCFEEHGGTLRWYAPLGSGQRGTNLHGYPQRHVVTLPPVLAEGRLYVASNVGTLCCLDPENGRILWVRMYDRGQVTGGLGLVANGFSGWHNSEPVVGKELMYVAPLDSSYAYGVDLVSGDIRFRIDRQDGRFLLGTGDGLVVVAEGSIRFYDPQGGGLIHEESFPKGMGLSGPPTSVGDWILCPFGRALGIYEVSERHWLVWRRIGQESDREIPPVGNITLMGNRLLSVGRGKVACWK